MLAQIQSSTAGDGSHAQVLRDGADLGGSWLEAASGSVIAAAFVVIAALLVRGAGTGGDAGTRQRFLVVSGLVFCSGALFFFGLSNITSAVRWGDALSRVSAAVLALGAAFCMYRLVPARRRAGKAIAGGNGKQGPPGPAGGDWRREEPVDRAGANPVGQDDERTRAAAEIRDLNARLSERIEELETLFNVLPVGVAIAEDRGCTRIRGNPAMERLLQQGPERNMSLSAVRGDAPTHFEVWRHGRCLLPEELPMQTVGREGCELRDFEESIVYQDGRQTEVIADIVPLLRGDSTVRGVVGVFRDVTDLKRAAEERLVLERKIQKTQKNESIARLAAGIAHDFNNLLAVIKGAAELARIEPGVPETAVQRLESIDVAVRRASELCEQMLSYAGQGRQMLQEVEVNGAVEKAVALVRGTFPRARDIRLELDGQVGSIVSDPSQLVQVVVSLLSNALEASARTAEPVQISTGLVELTERDLAAIQPPESVMPGRCIVLTVKDAGHGMDEGTRRELFTPFFTTKSQGRGLGLAAVLGIARSHRGGVRVWSQPNRGTQVEVFFPMGRTAEETPAPAEAAEAAGGAPARHPRRALVVDDEAMIRRVIASLLRSQGFEVETAGGGREAVEMVESGDYGLVVLDAAMPEMDGFETMRRIKASRPGLPFVIVSGSPQHEVADRFAPLEPVGVLHKPFEVSELNEVVGRIFPQGSDEAGAAGNEA